MDSFRSCKVSIVSSCIIPLSAVGRIQLAAYKALTDYAYVNNISLNIKTYSGWQALPAPVGPTLMPCTPAEVLSDQHFQESDIIFFFVWGECRLFDTLPLVPRSARRIVFYFGITRPELYPEQRENLEAGYRQAIVLHEADAVFVTSDYISDDVHRLGVPSQHIHKVPLFAELPHAASVPLREAAHQKVRLTFLSRFCSAKGVEHLFEALTRWDDTDWRLDLIYHADHSDQNLLEKYKKLAKKCWRGRVHWHHTIDDDEKMAILEDTDILVMPSLHEGFCIPIIEALSQGCALVYSDGGSIPEIGGGLGLQFPIRDVAALVQCLDKAARARRRGLYATIEGDLLATTWRDKAQAHVNHYSYENFKNALCDRLFGDIPMPMGNMKKILADRRIATLNAMGLQTRFLPQLPQYMIDRVQVSLQHLIIYSSIPAVSGLEQICQVAHVQQPVLPMVAAPTAPCIVYATQAHDAVMAIYRSLSWKVTAPLRAVAQWPFSMKNCIGITDPLRDTATREWECLIVHAQSDAEWQHIFNIQRHKIQILHASLSWRATAPLRHVYALMSRSNILRKVFAKLTGKPYVSYSS